FGFLYCASRLARLLLLVPTNVGDSFPPASEVATRPFAGRRSEDADAIGRPVGGEHLADDPRARDRPPEAAVVGVPAVVAEHEVLTARDRHRVGEVAAARVDAREDVGLVPERLAVDHRVPVGDRDPVAREPDHALDEVLARLLR